jgi:predicted 3-demethylubiquinone-9 3-methyltransferase (glyoxalase superfamily)
VASKHITMTSLPRTAPGTHEYQFNEAVSIAVECDTQQEIDNYWNKLTEGGSESQYGWLKDKFCVSWQIVPSILGKLISDPTNGKGVMTELLKMKKLDLEVLMNA